MRHQSLNFIKNNEKKIKNLSIDAALHVALTMF